MAKYNGMKKLVLPGEFIIFFTSAMLLLFSWLTQNNIVWALISLAVAQAVVLYDCADINAKDFLESIGLRRGKHLPQWIIVSIISAIIFSTIYRGGLHRPLFPHVLTFFSITAIFIGVTEELIYRGYLFWKVESRYKKWVFLICPLAHTAYKVALFTHNPVASLVKLVLYTFGIGIALVAIRLTSKSLIPCIIFHAVFDLAVYGDSSQAPWWVW